MNRSGRNGNEPDEVKRIDERIREELIRTAEPLPASYERRVREVLEHLPEKEQCQKDHQKIYQKKHQWAVPKVAAVILISLLSVSTIVTAGVGLYRQRQASVDSGKAGELYSVTQNEHISADLSSAELSETEGEKQQNTKEEPKEKVADANADEGVDISSTEDGKTAAVKSREFMGDLYGWDTEGADCEVKSDGEFYHVTLKKSGWACDAKINLYKNTMELSSLSMEYEGEEIWRTGIKVDMTQYREYGEKVWEIGKILVPEKQRKHLAFGYYLEKSDENADGMVYYYLTCTDGGGYLLGYSINLGMVYSMNHVADVKRCISEAKELEGYKYVSEKIY